MRFMRGTFMATIPQPSSFSSEPQPAWDVALLFPYQGDWSEANYLALETNHLVELVDGKLEVLPMPTTSHQLIVAFLYDLLRRFSADGNRGTVFFAGLRVRIRPRTIREPDITFISRSNYSRIGEDYVTAADLAMEVVSPGTKSNERDYDEKRFDYAALGVKEYWIVDPKAERISIMVLDGEQYRNHGVFAPGEQAASVLLSGFTVDVSATFAAATKLD
jgi:Uma2 family endonuclease